MRFVPAALALALVAACTPAEEPAMEAEAEAAMPAAPTLADFAGTWNTSATLTGTADPVLSTMTGTADGVWTMSLEGRENIPLTVSMVGDSLVMNSAEYESVLRPGVMVTVRTAAVMHDGMMMGNLTAVYKTDGVSETVMGTITGTRAPQ